MLKFCSARGASKIDLAKPADNGNAASNIRHQASPQLLRIASLPHSSRNTEEVTQYRPSTKSSSLKALNTLVQSIKCRISKGKTTQQQYSKSVECVLTASNSHSLSVSADLHNYSDTDRFYNRFESYSYETVHSDEELDTMATLRRAESERRGSIPGVRRLLPSYPFNTTEENSSRKSTDRLSHAQSIDGLNQRCNNQSKPIALSLYRETPLSTSFPTNLGPHKRSMSHRDLHHNADGIVDAFGFAANGGYHPAAYHSTSNLHNHRQQMDVHYTKSPEVPPPPTSYQPAPPTRNDSSRNYRSQSHNWRSVNSSQHSTPATGSQGAGGGHSSSRDMDKENYNVQRRGVSSLQNQQQPRFSSSEPSKEPSRVIHSSGQEHQPWIPASSNKELQRPPAAPMTNKASFGPVVRRAESMKRIMKKNRKTEQNGALTSGPPAKQQQQDLVAGSEVVTEKGRSVKSIVGMFDQPAIHAALAKAKVIQANNTFHEEQESPSEANDNGNFNKVRREHQPSNSRPERNSTQVVHIAKFIQIETPNKLAVNYSDAQTSPMQLSPTEPQRQRGSSNESAVGERAIIAKAETFSGGPKPKVAIITSSTSSYLSNEVFTPSTETIDFPVFDTSDVPNQIHQNHRTECVARTHHSDSATSCSMDSYELAHNSNIPISHQHPHQRHYPPPLHLHNQILRQELTDTETSNHYEDLESLRTGSIHEMENIYEPISPMHREPMTGNYMNFPSSPSADYMDMNSAHMQQNKQGDRRSTDMDHTRALSMDSSISPLQRQFSASNNESEFNDSNEEESYSNQVREASHRTLRQTSAEGNKYKSPTREELQLNKYNLNKSNVNAVQPLHRSSSVAIRPQGFPQYGSDNNLTGSDQDAVVKMRNKPYRTDSCRVQPRVKPVDRTSSYREPRGSCIDLRSSDPKAAIRDNLIDFCKRKSRDCTSMDSSMEGISSGASSGLQSPHPHPTPPSPARPAQLNVAMHRIQSERSFNTRGIPNPRSNSVDRGSSSNSYGQNAGDASMDSSYMQTWEASTVANRYMSTSSDRSPSSPLTTPSESPRVRKPLVAEVSPFGMPGQKGRKERPSRHETSSSSSSSVSSSVLKPMKANVPHMDNHDGAPTLPPRNYHPEDISTTHHSSNRSDNIPSSSDHDLSKPYQNVFNGSGSGKPPTDTDFDSGYTAELRRLSKKQQYVRSSSDATRPPQHNLAQRPLSQQSPQNFYHSPQNGQSNVQSSHSVQLPNDMTPSNMHSSHTTSPHHLNSNGSPSMPNANSSESYRPQSKPRLLLQNNNNDISPISRQQVLETDIDGPGSPDVQPPPPPRRHNINFDFKPPPKPPKMSSTIYNHEINHNEHSTQLTNHIGFVSHTKPERIDNIVTKPLGSPKPLCRNQVELSHRSTEDIRYMQSVSPVPQLRKDRRSESFAHSPRGEDMTVTSGDPSIHMHRRHSINKQSRQSRRSNSSSSNGKDDRLDSPKASPISSRLAQRETEFSAIEKPAPVAVERLNPDLISNVIHENRPKPVPFDRYHPNINGSSKSPAPSLSHSRQPSNELLDDIEIHMDSPAVAPRNQERSSVTPPRHSPKNSPSLPRSSRGSLASLNDSQRSTPSLHSNSSDAIKAANSDPATPVDKTFIPISAEILAGLAGQGINIAEKHKCISDENKARLGKMSALNTSPPPASKPTTIRHIRQKSSDEILCDTQVEHLGKSIKDATLSQVLSKPQRGTTDYLPGLFDDVLTKDIPRKQRQSLDDSPCHSKQNSEGDSLHSSTAESTPLYNPPFDELNTLQEKKEELVLVLKKKLTVLQDDQRFRQQEIEDNGDSGAKVVEIVESKCSEREAKKYKSYIDDVEKITKLLLKLSRRLARAENELRNAPMDATDDDKKSLEQKRNNLQRQHNDAKALKESIDRRKTQVVTFLHRSLDETEFVQYDNYISIKLKLIMESSDIEDQILHCEEQIAAVTAISS